MAVCTLDLSHPCFIEKYNQQSDPELSEALQELKQKIEAEHTSCHRVVQKFYGNAKFADLHGKIWKYDWGKSSASGRKSWRLVVVVPDPTTQPYHLIAGAIYAKNVAEQLPSKELAAIFACVTKPLAIAASSVNSAENFYRVPNGDGQTRSICALCYSKVLVSSDIELLDQAEKEHRCELATEEISN